MTDEDVAIFRSVAIRIIKNRAPYYWNTVVVCMFILKMDSVDYDIMLFLSRLVPKGSICYLRIDKENYQVPGIHVLIRSATREVNHEFISCRIH